MSAPSGRLRLAYETIARNEEQIRRLSELLAERVIDETKLSAYQTDYGGRLQAEGGAAGLLANAFAEDLRQSKAINYIEATFAADLYPELGQIVVTVKRETGNTPHQLRVKAEEERDRLMERLKQAQQCGLRQFRGNNTDEFVFGYDKTVIDEAITGHE